MLFAPFGSNPFNSGFTGRTMPRIQAAAVHPIDPDPVWAIVRPLAGQANPAAPLVRPLYAVPTVALVNDL
jgi:hypothetical protein